VTRIAMQVDICADQAALLAALNTHDGLASWWTTAVDREDDIILVDFPGVPEPFRLHCDRADEDYVSWTCVGEFPPDWKGTRITWDLSPIVDGSGTRVQFHHGGFADPDGSPTSAYTWGQLLARLKDYVEKGTVAPYFTAPPR